MPASPSLAPVSPASRPPSCASRLRRFRLRPPALSRDGNLLRQRRPAVGQQRRGLEQRRHRAQGLRWLPQQRAAAAQSALQLAQVFLAAAIHAPDPQPPPQHHRHHPAGDRGAPAYDMAEAEDIDFDLERRGILHIYHDAASFEAARRGNELLREGGLERYAVTPEEARDIEPALQTACHAGFYTPSDATGDIHKFTRGLAQACERLGVRFVQDADVAAIAARRAEPGRHGRRRRPAPGRRRGGLRRRGQPTLRAAAGRHGQHLSGQGLFDQRAPGRRRQPRGRAARQPARRGRQDRHQPAGRPLPRGRHRRVQRLQPGHPRRTRAAAGGLDPRHFPASGRRAWCPGAGCAR